LRELCVSISPRYKTKSPVAARYSEGKAHAKLLICAQLPALASVTVLALARAALFPIRLRLEVSEPQHI